MIEVVAAVIIRETEGKKEFLACLRPTDKVRGNLWEFPGGKIEEGETPQDALRRELQEELDVKARVGKLFGRATYTYPDTTVRISFYYATLYKGQLTGKEHQGMRWMSREDLDKFEFCPADVGILAQLRPFL